MKQKITYIRERFTPQEVEWLWCAEKFGTAYHATQKEKDALARAGHDFEKGHYIVADRIIDKNDGKEKTVFLKIQVQAIAVECPEFN